MIAGGMRLGRYWRTSMSDWTGSESQRKHQGTCPAPFASENDAPRFLLPAGVRCRVKNIRDRNWRNYVTKVETEFGRWERVERGCPVFRKGMHLVKVRWFDLVRDAVRLGRKDKATKPRWS